MIVKGWGGSALCLDNLEIDKGSPIGLARSVYQLQLIKGLGD